MAVGGESTMLAALNRFGPLRCMVGRLSADAAVSSAQLTFVTFLGQFRIEFGSYPVGQTMSIGLSCCVKTTMACESGRSSVPYAMNHGEIATYSVVKRRKPRPILSADEALPCLPPPEHFSGGSLDGLPDARREPLHTQQFPEWGPPAGNVS